MLNRHVLFPSILIIISAVCFYVISQFDEPMFQEASIGAKFFPRLIVVGQILLCVTLLIQYKLKKLNGESDHPIISKLSMFGVGYLVGYAILISFIGYLSASLVAFLSYLLFFKVKKPSYYIIATVFVFCIYYLFGEVFVIALPEGSLF